jgi:hypothetical protein
MPRHPERSEAKPRDLLLGCFRMNRSLVSLEWDTADWAADAGTPAARRREDRRSLGHKSAVEQGSRTVIFISPNGCPG